MATIKSFTDISQSKKLAEILPHESADMCYTNNKLKKEVSANLFSVVDMQTYYDSSIYEWDRFYELTPCWSLTALLNYLREIDFFPEIDADECSVTMNINYYNEEEARLLAPIHNIKVKAESFIDTCVEMIIELHEQKLL